MRSSVPLHFADQAAAHQFLRVPIGQVEHLAGADLAHVVEKFAFRFYKHVTFRMRPKRTAAIKAIRPATHQKPPTKASPARSKASRPSP